MTISWIIMDALCDPSVDMCNDGEALVRPGSNDLVQMTLTYYLNILLVPISLYVMFFLMERTPMEEETGTDGWSFIFIWLVMIAYHVVIFLPPALTLTIYLIFGSNLFLFGWTDDLALYFITMGTLDQGFYCHFLNSFALLLLFLRWFKLFELEYWLIYTAMAGYLEYRVWQHGVNAARRIDPSWDKRRGLLYPNLFYGEGWVKDHKQQSAAQSIESDADEVQSIVSL